MIKWVVSAMFLISGFTAFSEENELCQLQEWQYAALLHLVYGNDHLLSHRPWQALEHFQKGKSLLDKCDSSFRPIEFLITFSQIIAYDCLGFQDQCKQALGSLFLTISEYSEEEDQEVWNEEDDQASWEPKSSLEILHNLAALAPSPDVRELLLSLVYDLAEELSPALQFTDHFLDENYVPLPGAQDGYYAIELSRKHKSFWKKCKKWCTEVADWLFLIAKIIKGAKEVKDACEEWKGNPQASIVSYNEFNIREPLSIMA